MRLMQVASSPTAFTPEDTSDLFCFSHLRWNFVYQRPQHLMTRWTRDCRVFFFEEPLPADSLGCDVAQHDSEVIVLTPRVPRTFHGEQKIAAQQVILDQVRTRYGSATGILWYYTPMALPFTRHLPRLATVYDCMDELSGFWGCPPELRTLERELLASTDLVLTGGQSLYEAKRGQHAHVHAFPSSVDVPHFALARVRQRDPHDQASIPHPRIGFYGVIDERMDLALVKNVATPHPDWHFVFLGPVVKINPDTLPKAANIHYLDAKPYDALPHYLAGWDVAILPFALNEATRYISPTKTPEYLAGGKPVVSTPIQDVVHPYGEAGLVRVAADASAFADAIAESLRDDNPLWRAKADEFLSTQSWDRTWEKMRVLVANVIQMRGHKPTFVKSSPIASSAAFASAS